MWYNYFITKNKTVYMGQKIKSPSENLFYWSIFCISLALFFLSTSEAKAGLISKSNNTKNNTRPTVGTGKNFGKSLTGGVKEFGTIIGDTMGSVGSAFESTIQDGENNIVKLINGAQEKIQDKIGKIGEKTASPVNASQKEDALKAKTVEKKVAVKNQKTYSIFQAGLDKIENISKEVIH